MSFCFIVGDCTARGDPPSSQIRLRRHPILATRRPSEFAFRAGRWSDSLRDGKRASLRFWISQQRQRSYRGRSQAQAQRKPLPLKSQGPKVRFQASEAFGGAEEYIPAARRRRPGWRSDWALAQLDPRGRDTQFVAKLTAEQPVCLLFRGPTMIGSRRRSRREEHNVRVFAIDDAAMLRSS